MTYRELDNQMNRINKRLTSVSASLGRYSALYNHYAAIVGNAVRPFGLLKITPSAYGVETSIRRSKSIMNMSAAELNRLKQALDHIEQLMNKRPLKAERKRLKEVLNQAREHNKQPPIKDMKKSDYIKADKLAVDIHSQVTNALDFFYAYVKKQNDDDPEEPEYAEAMAIMHIDKRKKTYAELQRVIDLAVKYYNRSGLPDELGDFYNLRGGKRDV